MIFFGVLSAVGAMLGWGLGDFLFQRVARKTGLWEMLFATSLVGVIVLFPFVFQDIFFGIDIPLMAWLLLFLIVPIRIFSVYLTSKALVLGKIAVVEPVFSFEAPIVVLMGVLILGEVLSLIQIVLVVLVFISVLFAITEHHKRLHYHRRIFLESGALVAVAAAVSLGVSVFLIGIASRSVNPFFVIWFYQVFLMLVSWSVLMRGKKLKNLRALATKYTWPTIGSGAFLVFGWVLYGFAAQSLPISISAALSQGYVVVAVVMGVFVSREKLEPHQILGITFTFLGIVALGVLTTLVG